MFDVLAVMHAVGWQLWNGRPTRTSTSRCNGWITGRAWTGLTRGANFPALVFEGRELSADKPLLFLVAPALHMHPARDTLLRYISPEIEWKFVGIDERWREVVKFVFRKRQTQLLSTLTA